MAKPKKFKPERKPMDPERAALVRRITLHGIIASFFFGGLGVGFYFVKQYVEREVAFPTEPPTVIIKDRPRWMSDFLCQRIAATARPVGLHSSFDHDMLVDARTALESNPWVSKVYDVRRAYGKSPGDTLEINCEYRVPAAIVQWGELYWLVDRNGFKLPEHYDPQDVPKIVLVRDDHVDIRVIRGVKRPPPETGRKWPGDDLAAGLEMVQLLSDKSYAQEILEVNVSKFGSAREPQIVLVTKYGTEIRWGRAPSDRDAFIEVRPAQKLKYLQTLKEQYGRVDAKQPGGIDIRFDKVTYPSAEPAGATADGSR